MATLKKIQQDKEDLQILHNTVAAFEEIAVIRMQRIRTSILNYRDFITGLADIFHQVKVSYTHQILTLMKKKHMKNLKKLSLIEHNEKTIAVCITANTGLYGEIVAKTFSLFTAYLKTHKCDVVIIGRLGRLLFQRTFPNTPFTYFEVSDHAIDPNQLRSISSLLLSYKYIRFFYGKFESLTRQVPTILYLYQVTLEKPTKQPQIRFFSEPSLEKIMEFFEREIFSSLVEQTVREAELAKLASRMSSLEKAGENIDREVKHTEYQKRQTLHRLINKKQQAVLSGITLWSS